MRRFLILWLRGYPDIASAIEAIKEKDTREKYDILTLSVRRLFNTIGPEDLLSENSAKQWTYEGKMLTEGQKKVIVSEASMIVNTFTWKVLQADVKYKANKMMFREATTEFQLAVGKLWLYTIDTFNTRLKSLITGTGHFNKIKE